MAGDDQREAKIDKARLREARAIVGAYQGNSSGFCSSTCGTASRKLDAGEIDEFDLDDIVHRYKRADAGPGTPRVSATCPVA